MSSAAWYAPDRRSGSSPGICMFNRRTLSVIFQAPSHDARDETRSTRMSYAPACPAPVDASARYGRINQTMKSRDPHVFDAPTLGGLLVPLVVVTKPVHVPELRAGGPPE